MESKKTKFKIALLIIWIIFTISLVSWWLIFGLNQLNELSLFIDTNDGKIIQKQKMLIWEGFFLIATLIIGGIALFYYIMVERKINKNFQEFFATFSHELKTSIASLRLQVEILQEELSKEKDQSTLNRLINDTTRLQIQLENSLFLSAPYSTEMYQENINLKKFLSFLEYQFPEIKIICNKDCLIKFDKRALETIFQNIIQNAYKHSKATKILIEINTLDTNFLNKDLPSRNKKKNKKEDKIKIIIHDNGNKFQTDTKKLGKLFYRHTNTSGSGIGLYIVKKLLQNNNGDIIFNIIDNKLYITMIVEGTMLNTKI